MNRLLLHPKVFAPICNMGSIHFEGYRIPRKMDNVLDMTGQENAPVQKKKWCTPSFEIISKDTIQGGTAPGKEASGGYYS